MLHSDRRIDLGQRQQPRPARLAVFLDYLRYMGVHSVAETEGFEPSVPDLPVRRFSKPLVSATHPRLLRDWRGGAYSEPVTRLQCLLHREI